VARNKYGEDSTDSFSNYDDDDDDHDSSLDSSSSVDSSGTMDSHVEDDQEQLDEMSDFKSKKKNTIENNTTTTTTATSAPQKPQNESKSKNPSRPLLLEPSTPAQWIASFRTSTDDELISLSEEGCKVVDDDNKLNHYCDLSPLCAEIRSMATKIAEYRIMEKSLGKIGSVDSPKNNSDASTVCFYDFRSTKKSAIDDEDDDNHDEDLIDLCERILNASSSKYIPPRGKSRSSKNNKSPKPMYTLSRVRQKLVPSKLKEHIFWESLWVILYERKTSRAQQAFFQIVETSTNEEATSNQDILVQLQTAKECISEFKLRYQEETKKREQMEALVAEMWKTMPKSHEEEKKSQSNSSPQETHPCVKFGGSTKDSPADDEEEEEHHVVQDQPTETTPKTVICKHTGTWVMSADSIEFLAFPSEAKEALRTEKQKRLKRVMEEMAFILDSDHPKDSRGEWSCCHKTNYHDACG